MISVRRHPFLLLLLLTCAGCVALDGTGREVRPTPIFDPAAFFSGPTEGRGVLKIVFQRPVKTLVRGVGYVDQDGSIVLKQTVRRGEGPVTVRTWRLRRLGATSRYSGALSDASGPVSGEVEGDRLHLRFPMKGGLEAQQWLYLQSGGSSAVNVMIVSLVGLPIARLDEEIVRFGH